MNGQKRSLAELPSGFAPAQLVATEAAKISLIECCLQLLKLSSLSDYHTSIVQMFVHKNQRFGFLVSGFLEL